MKQQIKNKRKEWKELELRNNSTTQHSFQDDNKRKSSVALLKAKVEEFERTKNNLTKLQRLEKYLHIQSLVLQCVEGGAVVTGKAREGKEFIGDLLEKTGLLEFYDVAGMLKMLKSLRKPITNGMTRKESFVEIFKGFLLMLGNGNILQTIPFILLVLALSFIPWEVDEGANLNAFALVPAPPALPACV